MNPDEEFKKLVEEYKDCPEELYKMAKTKWQKLVAVEFFHLYKQLEGMEKNMKWLKWLIVAVFGTGCLGIFMQAFPKLFGL